jgi:hypothetical protein
MRQEAIISSDSSHIIEYLQITGRHGCNLDQLAAISRHRRTINSENSTIYLPAITSRYELIIACYGYDIGAGKRDTIVSKSICCFPKSTEVN